MLIYFPQVAKRRQALLFHLQKSFLPGKYSDWQNSPCCHFPLAAPTLLGGMIPCIARGEEQKVSINFY